MIIKINGREETIEKSKNIAELIASKNLSPERIVVEHNFKIVPRESWENSLLNENDSIEVVSFVGGG